MSPPSSSSSSSFGSSSSSPSSSSSSSSSPPPETHEMNYIVIPIAGGQDSSPSTTPRVVATQTLNPEAPTGPNPRRLRHINIDEHLLRTNEAIVRNQHWILFGQIGLMILIIVATLVVAQQLEGVHCTP
ncbi:hypothetical protein BO86DRAFT_398284 [Aspergillus japonicus CBS 114.51]|uniref:Uncharacterized protein n=1 Tax=Aspergillus japonicus CBS 114.51 TaxID=1448312 RepID=A0A8T8X5C8_ASPJA|nr:hypothetical protein BO86DRAFT_398284 [Aspergillus japonicus CBS 114.51]RAH83251.1 hypothetical protein BO86DRAFT_398284 [Aspergillus japonicus CBS 114.51]